MTVERIYFGEANTQAVSLETLFEDAHAQQDFLHQVSMDDLLEFFQSLTEYWQASGLTKEYKYLKNISEFLQTTHLQQKLELSLRGSAKVLDSFQDLGDPKMLFHAQPRGVAVHWLAGNVSILGLFSIFSTLITKNVSVVKASNRGYEELVLFLDTLTKVSTSTIQGKDIAKCISVILIDRGNTEAHTYLSQNADIRIAWGGNEAIESIMGLPKQRYTEDIIFGPKYSFAGIDAQSWKKEGKQIAQRFAIDVSVFDQYACSSPHTIFVEEEQGGEAGEFAKILAKQLDIVERTLLPKSEVDSGKSADIITLRAQYQITDTVYHSSGTEWTVILTNEPGLADGCFSRVIYVKPITDWLEIVPFVNRQKQTMVVAFSEETKKKYLDAITLHGVDRCPDMGFATYFEVPWDGMFVFDRMVRWISTYKKINKINEK